MTKEDLFTKIREWEIEHGESFNDYFSYDDIGEQSWAFWLLGKGFTERANQIISEILNGKTRISMEILYDIYPTYNEDYTVYSNENYDKNIALIAEFLISTPLYLRRVTEFFEENEDQDEE